MNLLWLGSWAAVQFGQVVAIPQLVCKPLGPVCPTVIIAAIVNLQVTPKDERAKLIIRAKVDEVMKSLMCNLGYKSDWKDEPSPPIERKWKPDPDQNEEWLSLIDEYSQLKPGEA